MPKIDRNMLEALAQTIVPKCKLVRAWRLTGGMSAEMTAIEVADPNGATLRLIVRQPGEASLKRDPLAAEYEYKLLRLTHSLGLPTPIPYYLGPVGNELFAPLLVIEYIEGAPDFAPKNVTDYVIQFATNLARIHRVDLTVRDVSFLRRKENQCNEVSGDFPSDAALDTAAVRDALAAVAPPVQCNASTLLHGDFWPGNALWNGDTLVAVIDWEDAALGDPLVDLAVSRLDVLVIFGIEAMESFTRHYLTIMRIDYTNLPYWDLSASLRLARLVGPDLSQWIASFHNVGRFAITEERFVHRVRLFVERASERLANQSLR